MAKIMSAKKLEFPNIYRSFTENIKRVKKKNAKVLQKLRFQGSVTFFILIVALIFLLGLHLLSSLQKQKEVNFERTKIESEIKLLQVISDKYPGYKDVYFQLAVLEYKLGDFENAKTYVGKALYLDPNFEKARNLQNLLKNY